MNHQVRYRNARRADRDTASARQTQVNESLEVSRVRINTPNILNQRLDEDHPPSTGSGFLEGRRNVGLCTYRVAESASYASSCVTLHRAKVGKKERAAYVIAQFKHLEIEDLPRIHDAIRIH